MLKKLVPKISETERIALTCCTIGFDREIFSGSPNYQNLLKYNVKLNDREREFFEPFKVRHSNTGSGNLYI